MIQSVGAGLVDWLIIIPHHYMNHVITISGWWMLVVSNMAFIFHNIWDNPSR